MKRKVNFEILAVLFSTLCFTGCISYPDESDYVTEQLVAVTNYDTSAKFGEFKTYAIADSVTIIDGEEVTKVAINDKDYPKLPKLVDHFKSNMNKLGYTYQIGKNADLGVVFSLMENTNIYVSNPWWYYGGGGCYWYFWDCGYYPYYPYYYPPVVGGYTTGTITMDMFSLKITQGGNKKAVWTGVVRGLYAGSHSDVEIASAIDDCFNQTLAFKK